MKMMKNMFFLVGIMAAFSMFESSNAVTAKILARPAEDERFMAVYLVPGANAVKISLYKKDDSREGFPFVSFDRTLDLATGLRVVNDEPSQATEVDHVALERVQALRNAAKELGVGFWQNNKELIVPDAWRANPDISGCLDYVHAIIGSTIGYEDFRNYDFRKILYRADNGGQLLVLYGDGTVVCFCDVHVGGVYIDVSPTYQSCLPAFMASGAEVFAASKALRRGVGRADLFVEDVLSYDPRFSAVIAASTQ